MLQKVIHIKKIILLVSILTLILLVSCEKEDIDTGDVKTCSLIHSPVCGVDGITYSNKCIAGNTEIAYEGECKQSMQKICENIEGKWVESADECEGISEDQCTALGGTFDSCASACRNDPEAQICTMQCVLVCKFD